MDLPAQKERNGAFMGGIGGVVMNPLVQGGHGRHGINGDKERQAKMRPATLGGSQKCPGRRLHHRRQYAVGIAFWQHPFFGSWEKGRRSNVSGFADGCLANPAAPVLERPAGEHGTRLAMPSP
jgi:hypothetical protein